MSTFLEIDFDRRYSEVSQSYWMKVQVINSSPYPDLFFCLKIHREVPEDKIPEKLVGLADLPQMDLYPYHKMDTLYAPELVAIHGSSVLGENVTLYPLPGVYQETTGDVPIVKQMESFYLPPGFPGGNAPLVTDYIKLQGGPLNAFAYDVPIEVPALGYSGLGTIMRQPNVHPYSLEPYNRDFAHIATYDSLGEVNTLFEKLKSEAQALVDRWNKYVEEFEGSSTEVFE